MKVNPLLIAQVFGLVVDSILKIQAERQGEPGPVKKAEVSIVVFAAIAGFEASGKLKIHPEERKSFFKDVDGIIDRMVGLMKKADWD